MPTKYTWPLIQSGETFQALINTLLQFEIPGTRVFGRAGRDSGQDARSADNKTVYQYKHHTVPSISKTIADAGSELTKIAKYRQPADSRYSHWQHAEEWVLVTNLLVNANDMQKWDNEVVPEFAKIGLKATLWSLETLEQILSNFPHVAQVFFEGQNRCILSLGEAYDFTRADEIGDSGLKVALLGREDELSLVDAFLSSTKKMLWMHGPGGIGKSRLLLEAGNRAEAEGKQVLWASEATMSNSSQWFSAVNWSLPTVLLLDEPQDPDLIRILAEQVRTAGAQMRDWKIIVSVRSPNDPVLNAAKSLPQNLRAVPLVLEPLNREMAKKLALELLAASALPRWQPQQKEDIAEYLSRLGNRYPIWIAMAVNVMAKDGDLAQLPQNAEEIARKYVAEVIERSASPACEKKQLQELLRWLATYEELDVQETALMSFIAKMSGFPSTSSFLECLNSLVLRKFVVRRGVNQRLYSIKPDVVRDFIVRDWLTWTVDNKIEPTQESKDLVSLIINGFEDKPLPNVQALVRALAKAELSTRLQGATIELLSPLVVELKRIAEEGTVIDQQKLLTFIHSFDFARLSDVLDILRIIRVNKKPLQVYSDFFGNQHEVTHDGVVSQLAWPLFNAARYAYTVAETSDVVREMRALSQREAQIPGLSHNDGKRADSLIPRMISGENDLYPHFKNAALQEAMSFVSRIGESHLDDPTLNLVKVLCSPFLSVEQEQTLFKNYTFTSRRRLIRPNSEEWLNRITMRAQIREALETESTPERSRLICWQLLSFAHSSANRAILNKKDLPVDFVSEIKADLKSDLTWVLSVLTARTLPLAEIRAARELWDWHSRFDKDDELKNIAAECEQRYQQIPLVQAFHVFFSYELYKEATKKASEIGIELGKTGDRESIRVFLRQAQEFAPANRDFSNVLDVARNAASYWESNSELAAFTHLAISSDIESLEFQFAIAMLNARLRMLRDSNDADALKSELQKADQAISAPEAKARLLTSLYLRPHPLLAGILTPTDLDFAIEQMKAIHVLKPWTRCQILAGMHHANWANVKSLSNDIYEQAAKEDRTNCFAALFEAFHFLDLFRVDYPKLAIKKEHFDWLLDLMVMLPDIDQIGEVRDYELKNLLERFERRDLAWLLGVIKTRISTEGVDRESFKWIPTRHRLSSYILELSPSHLPPDGQLDELLEYVKRKDMLGYILPRYAADIDPNGVAIPRLVAMRIENSADKGKEAIWEWTRFAGSYRFNSPAWRQIAKAAIKASAGLPSKDKGSVFVELLSQEIKSSSYPAGTMDPRPEQDLLARKEELQHEQDSDLLPFRQWHLAMAQAEFNQTVARYKEENEE